LLALQRESCCNIFIHPSVVCL